MSRSVSVFQPFYRKTKTHPDPHVLEYRLHLHLHCTAELRVVVEEQLTEDAEDGELDGKRQLSEITLFCPIRVQIIC